MVTVITEQLQKQSLDDLACKAFNISLPLPENANKGGCWNPYRFIPEERKWNVFDTSNSELPVNMGFPSLASYNLSSINSSSQNKSLWTEMNRRQQGLLRSHSQPCDLNERKCGIKRRHDEDVRWTRPTLDFFKMNQRRNLSSPACLELKERKALKDQSPILIPVTAAVKLDSSHSCPARSCRIETLSESDEEEEPKNYCDSTEAIPFQRTCEDLDLEMIEEN
ncbi:hypothetical protein scyTo_0001748 [Scyliorhinus torazame]|uniref:Uncharacterized protein n=1 Tax=Scyliorhinus torazame TaxID=75743 RepID=A0A401PFL0_SCYTO|nr:hypothetical protein [Scyliorhinus torazame]